MIRTICLAAALLAAACTRPTDDLEHRLDEALKGRRAPSAHPTAARSAAETFRCRC